MPKMGDLDAVTAFCPKVCAQLQILETKVKKLEQLVALKDKKIQTLTAKLNAAGLS